LSIDLDKWEAMNLEQLALKMLIQALESMAKDRLRVSLYGYDGSNWQPVKVTSDGKVVAWLG